MVLKVNEKPPEHRLMAQKLVRLVSGPADNSHLYASATKQISVSVPLRLLAPVEVFAERAGESRGSMVVSLITVALELAFAEMSPELKAEIESEIEARASGLYSEFDPQEGA